jgi:hypothetical protein
MKYKLLAVRGIKDVNIGDYIQALASFHFLPSNDGFINRDELKSYKGEDCCVIMNGWFMHNPSQWPPSPIIHPIFVAFHINTLAKSEILSNVGINYLKKHEPIGCRDYYTKKLLQDNNIKAYFSGCLTLTLGKVYKTKIKEEKYYFVDPCFSTKITLKLISKTAVHFIKDFRKIDFIAKKYPYNIGWLKKRLKLTTFYSEYSNFFCDDILLKADYICHQTSDYNRFQTDMELLNEAERLVKLYSKAQLVVTSRIHCALPCLGLETPVVFTQNSNWTEADACRLDGLSEMFNILYWESDHLESNFTPHYINKNHLPTNKSNWEPICAKLSETLDSIFKCIETSQNE